MNVDIENICKALNEEARQLEDPDCRLLMHSKVYRAAMLRSAIAMLSAGAVPEETAWLIEHNGMFAGHQGSITWTCIRPKYEGYGDVEFGSTTDASKALRLARKEDAEAVLLMVCPPTHPEWFREPYSVTEHKWMQAAPTPGQEKGKRVCPNKDQRGSCPLHNLHCAYPACEQEPRK